MKRLPAIVFAVLALATVGAFYLTQHLKVSDPLINGLPRADPPVINPVAGGVCQDLEKKFVSFRRTKVGFFLQHNSSVVVVYVLDASGHRVAEMSGSGRRLIARFRNYYYFSWNGREFGGKLAPDGTYSLQALLEFDRRAFLVGKVAVLTATVPPAVTVSRGRHSVTIDFAGAGLTNSGVAIYQPPPVPQDGPHFLTAFRVDAKTGRATWNERIDGKRAAPGEYLLGLIARNPACTIVRARLVRVTISRPRRHHRH